MESFNTNNKQQSIRINIKRLIFVFLLTIGFTVLSAFLYSAMLLCMIGINPLCAFREIIFLISILNIGLWPLLLIIIIYLSIKTYHQNKFKGLLVEVVLPILVSLFISMQIPYLSQSGPYLNLIDEKINIIKSQFIKRSVLFQPEKICYLYDGQGIHSDSPMPLIRWEGKVKIPSSKMEVLTDIGIFKKNNNKLEELGGLYTNGREYIDDKFIDSKDFQFDGQLHNLTIDFPYESGDFSDPKLTKGDVIYTKPEFNEENVFGATVSLNKINYYNILFPKEFTDRIFNGPEPNEFSQPYCISIK
jgi:hypothetical protein